MATTPGGAVPIEVANVSWFGEDSDSECLWNGANESVWWIESNGMNATRKGLQWFNYFNVIYEY